MSGRGDGNLLVVQGGGPTPVLNASLYGVIAEARVHSKAGRVFGACGGIVGVCNDDLVDLTDVSETTLRRARNSPGATLGTTRYKPTESDYERVVQTLRANQVRQLILIGGNGSLRGAELIARISRDAKYDLCVVGVPKTIDNDIPVTDRCPGFGSAARYVAQSVRDLGMDVRALHQPVSIYETMGRSVGWLAASSVLGRIDDDHAPHLVYLPERAFDVDAFLSAVDRVVTRLGWCVVVVTEGIKRADGKPVFEIGASAQADALGRPVPGGVAAYLAEMVAKKLDIRCRSEKPGLCGRASMLHASPPDVADAEAVGRAGVRAALDGATETFVALLPSEGFDAQPSTRLVPLTDAAGGERLVPDSWLLDDPQMPVAPAMLGYLRRCAGALVDYATPLTETCPRVTKEVTR